MEWAHHRWVFTIILNVLLFRKISVVSAVWFSGDLVIEWLHRWMDEETGLIDHFSKQRTRFLENLSKFLCRPSHFWVVVREGNFDVGIIHNTVEKTCCRQKWIFSCSFDDKMWPKFRSVVLVVGLLCDLIIGRLHRWMDEEDGMIDDCLKQRDRFWEKLTKVLFRDFSCWVAL